MIQNKIRYLALLATIGLLSILYNEYFMIIILLTVAVLPFLMFGLLSYIYGMISVELISTVHVANKGETIPVSLIISNRTIFPVSNITLYLTYGNSFSGRKFRKELMVSADRRTRATVTCNLLSEHAGNLEISLTRVRVYDYLKMFSLRKRCHGEIKVAVLPVLHEITEEYLTNRTKMQVESDYYSTVKSGDDPSEVFTIREYREGDRPTRIHWKLSVKQDQLMIKEFSEPMNCSILIFANLSVSLEEDVLLYMDALMECALSLSYSFLMKGQIHYFSWYDEAHGVCRRVRIVKEKDLFEAVDGLLQSGPYSKGVDVMTAYLAEHPNDQYSDLFYVTGEVSKPQLDSLSLIKANIRQIIYVSDTGRYSEVHNGKIRIKLPITEEVMKKIAEMGIGLLSVDTGNVQRNLESLKLG
jgi:hypothetical protein